MKSSTEHWIRRKTYLSDEVLKEVAGRLKFGASDLEGRLKEYIKPEPKPWTYPDHPHDEAAAEFGLRGFEFKVLQDAAMREMPNHTILQFYYKRFLMAAKMVLDDELEKARHYERQQSEEKNKRDSSYQHKLKEWENRNKQLTNSWTNVRETIRTRWGRLGRSIGVLLEKDAHMGTMDPRDQIFIDLLENRNILKTDNNPDIDQRRVLSINWDAYEAMSIEDINEVIQSLNDSSAGGFIPQPTVTKLEESS